MPEPMTLTITLRYTKQDEEEARAAGIEGLDRCGLAPTEDHDYSEVAVLRFGGRLAALFDEYGTAYPVPGLDQEKLEALIEQACAIWPPKYDPEDPVCHRCGYRRSNQAVHPTTARTEHCPYGFLEPPEHLRF